MVDPSFLTGSAGSIIVRRKHPMLLNDSCLHRRMIRSYLSTEEPSSSLSPPEKDQFTEAVRKELSQRSANFR